MDETCKGCAGRMIDVISVCEMSASAGEDPGACIQLDILETIGSKLERSRA